MLLPTFCSRFSRPITAPVVREMGHEDGEFKKTGLGYNGEVKISLNYKEQMFKKEEEEEGGGWK